MVLKGAVLQRSPSSNILDLYPRFAARQKSAISINDPVEIAHSGIASS